jgi:flagellar hook-length control protein FliK
MASIPSSGSAPPSGAASQPATMTGGTSTTASQAAASGTPGSFMQLVAQLLGGAGAEQPSSDLGDLAGVELCGNQLELQGDDSDGDSDTGNDDVLALASLLPGLAALTQPSPTPSAEGTSGATASPEDATGAIDGARIAERTDADVVKAAIDALAGDASGDASDLTDAAARPDSAAAPTAAATSPTQSAPPQLHALMTAHTAAGDVDVTPDASLRAPVGSHAWKDELGTQLTWMALNGREAASLRLSPEHLGPLEVRISMHEGTASVYFGAGNADTRSALEQSLPRLRELFAANGLVLADAGVSRDTPRHTFKAPAESPRAARNIDASSGPAVTSVTLARAGLVDTYV